MDTGDFDDTPAPSARPSHAALRTDDHQTSQQTAQDESFSGPRFHFFKTSTSGPVLFSRDGPSSPVLSQAPSTKTPEQPQQSLKTEDENQTTSSGQSPTLSSPVSPARLTSNRGTSPPIPVSERICLDPMLHRKQNHAHAHHPGLLKGADFCDWGEGVKESEYPELSPQNSPSSEDYSIRSGEIHRLQPDGSIAIEEVSVPVGRTPGHSRALKVRPAFNFDVTRNPDIVEDRYEIKYEPSRNKVRPFDPGMEGSPRENVSLPVRRPSASTEDPMKDSGVSSEFPASKVRHAFDPSLQSPREED